MGLKIAGCGLALVFLLGAGTPALADDEQALKALAHRLEGVSATQGQDRIAAQFSGFAGSPGNADNLVNGLRGGTPIMLIGGNPPETVAFNAPTRPMGDGNVFISLSLAQQRLATHGIALPSPTEIEAALVGGTIMVNGQPQYLDGLLALRAQGLSWGRIAHATGTKLGPVVSGIRAAAARHGTVAAAGARGR